MRTKTTSFMPFLMSMDERIVPAVIPTIPIPTAQLAFASASFDQNTGALTVNGTARADNISLVESNGVVELRGVGLVLGNPYNGAPGWAFNQFASAAVQSVVVNGNGGADTLSIRELRGTRDQWNSNSSSNQKVDRSVTVNGGAGNDTIFGGEANATLNGDAGDDTIDGGNGNETIHGGADNDVLRGNGGNDVIGAQLDIRTEWVDYKGPPRVPNIPGKKDEGSGGRWVTTVRTVIDEPGDDTLYGGEGNDLLAGGSGNDGLFGGPGVNRLVGGGGADRILTWSVDDHVVNLENKDAVIKFEDTKRISRISDETDSAGKPIQAELRYAPAAWTEQEIIDIDGGLAWAQQLTGNARFLQMADLSDHSARVFRREGAYIPWSASEIQSDPTRSVANIRGPLYGGWNDANGIAVNDRGIRLGVASVQTTVVHELAHNWDTKSQVWADWLKQSGWRDTAPSASDAALYTRSGNGRWWFKNTAQGTFARALANPNDNYSTWTPMEDWTTTWEAYRQNRLGLLPQASATALAGKFAILDRLVQTLAQQS